MPKKPIPVEVLIDLKRRLATFAPRSHERRLVIAEAAHVYGVSEQTLYRALAQQSRPKALRRADRGAPRVLPPDQMERYCEWTPRRLRRSARPGTRASTPSVWKLKPGVCRVLVRWPSRGRVPGGRTGAVMAWRHYRLLWEAGQAVKGERTRGEAG